MAATEQQIVSFIKLMGPMAVAECNRRIARGEPFVLPSVCMAQSALETGWGTSGLMTRANAFFGIKAGGSWTGKIYVADTWEVSSDGTKYNTVANFRAYDRLEDGLFDYYELITKASRYSNALSYGTDSSKWLTPKETITAIWKAGYATDNLYVQKIMDHINPRKLYEWDSKITGVETGTGMFSTASFKKSDFVQGKLVITDSGRSVQNDRTVSKYLAIEWDKAPTLTGEFKITGTINDKFTITLVKLVGNVATEEHLNNVTGVVYSVETKIGIYLSSGNDVTPADLDDSFEISFTSTAYPDNSASYSGVIAHFVKVE